MPPTTETDNYQSQLEGVPSHMAPNLEAVATMHSAGEERVGPLQRTIETLTAVLGRPRSLLYIVTSVVVWVGINAFAPRLGIPQLDPPPFAWLQGAVSLSALFVTTFILITQNRQGRLEAQRQHLDLQINLVAEQKIAKLIALVEELRRDLPNVANRVDVTAEAMTHAVDPHAVVSALKHAVHIDYDPENDL